ncbi:MAG: hypothetical protein ABJB49_08770 [Nitrospirota bacterium]
MVWRVVDSFRICTAAEDRSISLVVRIALTRENAQVAGISVFLRDFRDNAASAGSGVQSADFRYCLSIVAG